MNPFFNPLNSLPLLGSYFFDPPRLVHMNAAELKRYQNKAFKRIVKYAYETPLYHQKYKKAGIHASDITGIDDIVKLPFITKQDIRNSFLDGVIPRGYDGNKGHMVSTGGTTGKSVSIYTDFCTIAKAASPVLRELQRFHLNWLKARFIHIGNFNPNRIDLVAQESFHKPLTSIIPMDNKLNLDINIPMTKLINTINEFRPDLILTYPAVFQHLAYLKRKGYGEHITPTVFWTAGAMLDEYTRRYVEGAFNCPLRNIYTSVESQADIAFECLEKTWHIHADFFHLEAIDKNHELVSAGEQGHLAITRLFGRGTPIIRYTGMDDWVRLRPSKDCICGLSTPVIEGGVEGRMRANIILPGGKVFPPGAFCFIESALQGFDTFKIKQYQIIQHRIDAIEILLVIDEELRDVGPSVSVIMNRIMKAYQKKVGPDVTILVKEVDTIKYPKNARKPPPIVVSHVKLEEGYRELGV